MSESAELSSGLLSSEPELRRLFLDAASFTQARLCGREGRFRHAEQTTTPRFPKTESRGAEQGSSKEGPSKEPGGFGADFIADGMPDSRRTPTDDDLRAYFRGFAPGHEAILGMRFTDAAALYRWLAVGIINNAPVRTRYLTIARQLDFTQQMKQVCRSSLSFPPTGEEVESYFQALAASAVVEIQSAFEDYVDSFFSLSHVVTSGQDVSATPDGAEPEWCTQIQAAWELIQRGRHQDDARRTLDPVGHALLGKKCLEAAGFSGGHFAVASRRVALSSGDSVSSCLMFTASRISMESRRWSEDPHIEVVVVANGSLRWAAAVSAIDVEAAEEVLLWSAFQEALDAPLDEAGRIAQERVVRLGSRGNHLGGIGGGATAVRVSICYPAQQLSNW